MTSAAKPGLIERVARSRFIVPYIVGFALFMQMLDSTVIAMALPDMARSLNADPVRLNIAITSYLLSVSVFIPVSGWVADRFGARNVFVAAIVLFTVSSVFCGLAGSLGELVAARLAQGVAGAMMVPVGRIVMLRSVSKADLMQATTYLTLPALLGPVLGPPVGGFITTFGSWRWIFLMNVPVGVIGVVLALTFIRNTREDGVPPLDVRGFVLTGVALACLVLGFETLGHGAISWQFSTLVLLVGLVCALLYVHHARRTLHPVVDFGLMRIRTFRASIVGGNLCRFDVGAAPFLMALLLQVVMGMSPFAAGMITFTGATGAIMAKILITPVFRRFGFRLVLTANAVMVALTIVACAALTPLTPQSVIMIVLFVGGMFRSLQLTGVNALVYADIPPERMSSANTLSSMLQQVAFSMGVSIAALAIQASMTARGAATISIVDIRAGFIVLALLAAASAISFLRLPPRAGEEVSRGRTGAMEASVSDGHA
ncbi:EmrB/QacA subfamily drug resistance transporter [Pseudochelatococcus lubricantis]|uniref:EmrB/QacA subfamily drug resistance transporter n=1 Tax=Pseudochelatococcus lubricantis TaxID=1538102 RepID=A0ABX0UZH6_9HYPH|nr:DHA2 family efflux MFS transporter permease subunit [Pseudochelatococcus lubricantis]NIJ56286.1 EmrB/QacA subfamily drug resistance transporter [Pseudochelatococcus lubricantis]